MHLLVVYQSPLLPWQGGEEEFGCGVGVESEYPVGHEAGVGELAGEDFVANLDIRRILSIEVVNQFDGAVETGIGGHSDGLSRGIVPIVLR